ncbi:MAG: hypothetical protein ACYTX0_48190, partial [Nostoc sp.]
MATSQVENELPDEKHSEDKHLSSVVTASKIASHSLANTLDFNLPHANQFVPSFTATTEIARTRKPELVVANATKVAPDTPVKTPSSSLLRQYQPVRWHSGQLPSGASATMTTEVNSKAKTMASVALATEVKSNAPSVRMPVGAL